MTLDICRALLCSVSFSLTATYKPSMLNVITLNVITLNVIMLSVVAPIFDFCEKQESKRKIWLPERYEPFRVQNRTITELP